MTLHEKVDTLFGEKNNKRLLMKSKADCKDPQSYICQIGKGDFSCTQIQASLQQVVHSIKSRMANLNSLSLPSNKRMLEAAKNYSITELEMCGLEINIASFTLLLKRVDFDAVVDHLAITHIMRSKAEPAATQIKRLLELLSAYSFNLYYTKRKDMVLSDFPSSEKSDNSNPHEIITILFSLRKVLHESYYRLKNLTKMTDSGMDKYMVQPRAQAKSRGTKLPEVHRAKKDLIPHIKPEKSVQSACPIPPTCHLRPIYHIPHTDQRPPTNALPPVPKPRIGQGRAGIRRKPKVAPPIPKVIQTPTLPIPMLAQRTVLPLTEPIPHHGTIQYHGLRYLQQQSP